MLRCDIGRHEGKSHQPSRGTGIHNGPAPIVQHRLNLVAHARPDTGNIHGHDALELCHRIIDHRFSHIAINACSVKSGVQPAIFRDGEFHRALDGIIIGYVAGDEGAVAFAAQLRRQVSPRRFLTIDDNGLITFGDESFHRRPANPRAAASNKSHFTSVFSHLVSPQICFSDLGRVVI